MTFISLFFSCTIEDKRTSSLLFPPNPNCPSCNGCGYKQETTFLFFYSYKDCACKHKRLPVVTQYQNINFKGIQYSNKSVFLREVEVYIYQDGKYKYDKKVDLWRDGNTYFVIDGLSAYLVFTPSSVPYSHAYFNEWGYCFYFN